MNDKNTDSVFSHRINEKDVIIKVCSHWQSFVEENNGASHIMPENIIGTTLWDHIIGAETKHLYEIILQKVRANKRPAKFHFRCDSPELRRFLTLEVIPHDDNSVEFISTIIKTESRDPVHILRTDIERSDEFLRICSMCKKIALSDTNWVELEVAIEKLKLFDLVALPHFTHSMCKACYKAVMAELDD